jgi:hypothetical protein
MSQNNRLVYMCGEMRAMLQYAPLFPGIHSALRAAL